MEQYTDCELPDLLEEAMQVIAVLRWRRPDDDTKVREAADAVMKRLYNARRDASEVGCRCCQRAIRRERSGRSIMEGDHRGRDDDSPSDI